jgi:hypothetical protein
VLASTSAGAVVTTLNNNANSLAAALSGTGFHVTNATLSSDTQNGTFSGGAAATGIDSGVVLTTGQLSCVGSNNTSTGCTGAGTGTTLSLTFTLDSSNLFFNYAFASEEYNEFVGSQFNDSFQLLLDGTNIAQVPGGGGVVSINNVNLGSNSAFYRNNTGASSLNLPIEYDGLTTVLTATATGLSAGSHTLVFSIQDVGDTNLDSAVFIQGSSIGIVQPPTNGGIPEPSSWALMIMGFGGAGAMIRQGRRRNLAAVA